MTYSNPSPVPQSPVSQMPKTTLEPDPASPDSVHGITGNIAVEVGELHSLISKLEDALNTVLLPLAQEGKAGGQVLDNYVKSHLGILLGDVHSGVISAKNKVANLITRLHLF